MKHFHSINKPALKQARRLNRNNPTPWEYKLWNCLKMKKLGGYKFRRQVSIENYIVDFCCLELKLIIELDGSGHLHPKQIQKDNKRIEVLNKMGFNVIRFNNNEIDENLNEVLGMIADKCDELNK